MRVKDLDSETLLNLLLPMVREVFRTILPEIPPEWKINFFIDLLPDMNPISIPSYRTALTELKDLKGQLKDLPDKGFIQPYISP